MVRHRKEERQEWSSRPVLSARIHGDGVTITNRALRRLYSMA
ncbi:MAG: hypothetical protein JWM83_1204 [Candidatus Angelobacter sp.]|nr:hypothetical protein [Candidatus Angelobacter sp.]